MSHNQDLSEVFLKNDRQQKLLELQYQTLEKLWLTQLRIINREKLDVTSEFVRLQEERKKVTYLQDTMKADDIRKFSEKEQRRLKRANSISHNKFDFDHQPKRASISDPLQLPAIGHSISLVRRANSRALNRSVSVPPFQNNKQISFHSEERSDKMCNTRLKSVSDTHLHRLDGFMSVSAGSSRQGALGLSPRGVTMPVLDLSKGDNNRGIKHRMVMDCALPPVKEVANKRKLSI